MQPRPGDRRSRKDRHRLYLRMAPCVFEEGCTPGIVRQALRLRIHHQPGPPVTEAAQTVKSFLDIDIMRRGHAVQSGSPESRGSGHHHIRTPIKKKVSSGNHPRRDQNTLDPAGLEHLVQPGTGHPSRTRDDAVAAESLLQSPRAGARHQTRKVAVPSLVMVRRPRPQQSNGRPRPLFVGCPNPAHQSADQWIRLITDARRRLEHAILGRGAESPPAAQNIGNRHGRHPCRRSHRRQIGSG